MNKLRQSFRRKKDLYVPEASRPHQWQTDEESVRTGKCSFQVKYLGHVEVDESRGMHICEDAVKRLRATGKKAIKAVLWVSADGLRVVDEKTKDLLVDQTIEKVSFCAPDRNFDRAFSYICRDGTTRRWICHCFMAVKDTGERLSHAVGCAFAACLERKQKREKECGVTATFDASRTTFTREGSFRVTTATEQAEREEVMKQIQDAKKAAEPEVKAPAAAAAATCAAVPLPPAPVLPSSPTTEVPVSQESKDLNHPHAIPRRHAPVEQLARQGSFRGFPALSQKMSPFKRQLSLRINELPSTVQRKSDFQITNPGPEFVSACGLLQANHKRTPSEADRWLEEVSKTVKAQQRQSPVPAIPPQPLLQPVLAAPKPPQSYPANTFIPPQPVPVAVIPGLQPSFIPVQHPYTIANGMNYPAVSVPVVGITPSQMVANVFGVAGHPQVYQPKPSPGLVKQQTYPTYEASSTASSPFFKPAPQQHNGSVAMNGLESSGWELGVRHQQGPAASKAIDPFEAQWAALEGKSKQRSNPSPTNPFSSDLQKTFEIEL
ncbi:hypothetical protein FKM82_016620 [Ascaphus truei]